MRKIKCIFIYVCMIAIICSGCITSGRKHTQEAAVSEKSEFLKELSFPEEEQMESFPTFGEREGDGRYHKVWTNFSASDAGYLFQAWPLTLFSDWKSGDTYPLCGIVNCMHQDESCLSYKTDMLNAIYDGEFVSFFRDSGTETEFYKQKLNGTDRQKLFSVEGYVGAEVIYEGTDVYFFTYGQKEDKSWVTYQLWHGDLSVGDVKMLHEFDEPNIEVQLYGKYQNELIIFYQNYMNENKDSSNNMVPVTESAVISYDIVSQDIAGIVEQQADKDMVICIDLIGQGYLAYQVLDSDSRKEDTPASNGGTYDTYSGRIGIVDLQSKHICLLPRQEGLIYSLTGLEDLLLFHRLIENGEMTAQFAYNLKTGEVKELTAGEIFYIAGQTDSYLYGQLAADEADTWHYILKKDYLAGKDSYMPFSTMYRQE